jgi:hypothetical protein
LKTTLVVPVGIVAHAVLTEVRRGMLNSAIF